MIWFLREHLILAFGRNKSTSVYVKHTHVEEVEAAARGKKSD